jgi:hypothetical protein
LQKQFRKVVEIENYHGVSLSASQILLEHDFPPLFHHVEEMKANVAADAEATFEDRAQMDALYCFATIGYPANLYEDARNKITQGFITYDELWALFRPGDFIVYKNSLGQFAPCLVSSVKLEEERYPGKDSKYEWFITAVNIISRGSRFEKVSNRLRIDKFSGTKRITDLMYYPLSHHESRDTIREFAIQGGKDLKRYCESEPVVMNYEGPAKPVLFNMGEGDFATRGLNVNVS